MPARLLNVNRATLIKRPNTVKEFALSVVCFNSKHGFISLSNQCRGTIVASAASIDF
jgi:hypothetical protein